MHKSFDQFWQFYLNEHSKPLTRSLHVIGTSLGFLAFAISLYKNSWLWLIIALASGYGLAWISHFFIEKNKPASFKRPYWSFLADLKLLLMTISGEIDQELAKLNLS